MYGTLDGANIYFAELTLDSTWETFPQDKKIRALNRATILIDTLRFAGEKSEATQENEFPRNGEAIPKEIMYATYEIARAVLAGRDIEHDDYGRNKTSIGLNRIAAQKDPRTMSEAKAHGIPSVMAWDFLRPYLVEGGNFTLEQI